MSQLNGPAIQPGPTNRGPKSVRKLSFI